MMKQNYHCRVEGLFDKSQKKRSDGFSYPAEGGYIDAEVGGNMFQGYALKDVRVFLYEELVTFRCCKSLELYRAVHQGVVFRLISS